MNDSLRDRDGTVRGLRCSTSSTTDHHRHELQATANHNTMDWDQEEGAVTQKSDWIIEMQIALERMQPGDQ